MNDEIKRALQLVINNWEQMQKSEMDEAEADADRFEASFYQLIEELKKWMGTLKDRPTNYDAALKLEEIDFIINHLPAPLYINFETELELMLEELSDNTTL